MAESKLAWLNPIRLILMNNLSPFDTFVAHLGTEEFNATDQWGQLNDKNIETRFFKFMDVWYEKNPQVSSKDQIISALKDINRNDIIKTIDNDVKLREQLRSETDCSCKGGKSSKPAWIITIRTILIDKLGQLDLFVALLGTSEFNATDKWDQLNQNKNKTQFSMFMDVWYQQPNPRINKIISALKVMHRNDIIKTILGDGKLRQQLIAEKIITEDYGVRSLPKQATSDDGYSSHENKHDQN